MRAAWSADPRPRPRAMLRPVAIAAAAAVSLLAAGCQWRGSANGNTVTAAPTWSKSFGGPGFDSAAMALRTAEGGYLYVGSRDGGPVADGSVRSVFDAGDYADLWIAKLDALGDLQWERSLGDNSLDSGALGERRDVTHVAAAPDGGSWLVGIESSGARSDVFVQRLDASGTSLWRRSFDSGGFPGVGQLADGTPALAADLYTTLGDVTDTPAAITATRDGGLLVAMQIRARVELEFPNAGSSTRVTSRLDARGSMVLKIGPDGTANWRRGLVYGPLGERDYAAITGIREAPDGSAIFTRGTFVASVDAGRVRWLNDFEYQNRADFYADASGASVVALERVGLSGPAALDGVFVGGTAIGDRAGLGPRSNSADILRLRADGSTEWRYELDVAEGGRVRAAQPVCFPAAAVGSQCRLIVLIDPNSPGAPLRRELYALPVSADGTPVGPGSTLPRLRGVCDFRADPLSLSDGRLAFRALVSDTEGRLGTIVIDDLGNERVPFQPVASWQSCESSGWGDVRPRLGDDGRVVQFARAGDGARQLIVTQADGSERLRLAFASAREPGTIALRLARSVLQTDDDDDGQSDDGYLVAADVQSGDAGQVVEATLVKLDASGAIVWQRAYPGLQLGYGLDDTARRIVQTFDGTGAARRASGYAFLADARGADDQPSGTALVRVDATGAVLGITGPLQSTAGAGASHTALAGTPDGGFVATAGAAVAKLTAGGVLEWRRRAADSTTLSAIEVVADGYVVAGSDGSATQVRRLDSAGEVRWARRYPLVASLDARVAPMTALDVAPDGTLLIGATVELPLPRQAGTVYTADQISNGERRFDLRVLHLDADGAVRWDRQYGGLEDDALGSLEATPDGGAIIAARSGSLGEFTEAWLLRIGPDGRAAPGCAAQIVEGAGLARALPLQTTMTALDPPATTPAAAPSSRVATLALRSPLAAPVVARQCSAVAGPETPEGPPPNTSELTVAQGGTITGVVSSVPSGILCGVAGGATCAARFVNGTRVSVDVDPGSRRSFEAWTGCDAVVGTRCEVVVDRARTVSVRFAADPQPDDVLLQIADIAGRGRVYGGATIDCVAGRLSSAGCRERTGRGSQLRLAAIPERRRSFLGWGGGCASFGTTREIVVPMDGDRICSAEFSGPPASAPSVYVTLNPQLPPVAAATYTYAGNVTSSPAGIDCGARDTTCVEGFVAGTNVVLTGEATLPGWEFERFVCPGAPALDTSSSVDLGLIVSDVNCEARFSADVQRLQVRLLADDAFSAPGRVRAEDGGLDCVRSCDRAFGEGRVVTLRVEPDTRYVFNSWQGCQSVSGDPLGAGRPPICVVTMSERREVVAFFSRIGFGSSTAVLAVGYTPASAGGRVTSRPGSIDCRPSGGTCSASYDVPTDVVLDVVPDPGGGVVSNVGCDTYTPAAGATPARCAIRIDRDRAVTFGTTRVNAPPTAVIEYEPSLPVQAQLVTLDGRASTDDVGIAAYRWDFDDDGSFDAIGPVASVSYGVAGNYVVRLRVEDADGASGETSRLIIVSERVQTYPLTVTRAGSGVGTVTSLPAGIDCGGDCSEEYVAGTVVTLSASAAGGSTFAGWQGCPQEVPQANAPSQCRVTVDGARGVTASFAAVGTQATLTLQMQGNGDGVVEFTPTTTACSKASEPTCLRSFAVGTQVVLDATAYTGFRIDDWNGCDTITQNGTRCTVLMTASRTVGVFIVR